MSIRGRDAVLVLAMASWAALCAAPASACDTPVFRYALERWPPDTYRVVVFHDKPLSATQQPAVDYLQRASAEGGGSANMTVRLVDLSDKVDPSTQALWRAQGSAKLPHVVVVYPLGTASGAAAWRGSLSTFTAEAIVDSPARRRIADRILADHSGVWVLVESGDKAKDEAAADLLAEQLSKMPKALELPARFVELQTATDNQEAGDVPAIKFSLMRLSRSDPAEAVLLAALLGSEPDLNGRYASQPIAFPVFGRGRALYALVGKGINERNVLEACAHLVGMCSCEVKDQNPGTDLLMATDWDAEMAGRPTAVIELPAVIAPIEPIEPTAEADPGAPEPARENVTAVVEPDAPEPARRAVPVAETIAQTTDAAPDDPLLRNTLIVVGVMIVVVVCLVLFVMRRPTRS